MVDVYTMEPHWASERWEALAQATVGVELEDVISVTQKTTYAVTPFTWDVWSGQTQTQNADQRLQGAGGEDGEQ